MPLLELTLSSIVCWKDELKELATKGGAPKVEAPERGAPKVEAPEGGPPQVEAPSREVHQSLQKHQREVHQR